MDRQTGWILGACLAACAALTGAGEVDPFERATWLAGCWKRESGNRVVEEQWMAPRAGLMLGMSRTVRDGRVVEYEHTRLEARGNDVFYVALPSGQALSEFKLIPGDGPVLEFANPEHDFPNSITYQPVGADSMVASIAGGGREVHFPSARTACPGTWPPPVDEAWSSAYSAKHRKNERNRARWTE